MSAPARSSRLEGLSRQALQAERDLPSPAALRSLAHAAPGAAQEFDQAAAQVAAFAATVGDLLREFDRATGGSRSPPPTGPDEHPR